MFKNDYLEIMYHYGSNGLSKRELLKLYLYSNLISFLSCGQFIVDKSQSQSTQEDFLISLSVRSSSEYKDSILLDFTDTMDFLTVSSPGWFTSISDRDAITSALEIIQINDSIFLKYLSSPHSELISFFKTLSSLDIFILKNDFPNSINIKEYISHYENNHGFRIKEKNSFSHNFSAFKNIP